ncbi:MAG TPA: hypothetical protein VIV40_09355 [Kofleriaceae bacterium]
MWQALAIGLCLVVGCGGKTGNYKVDYAGPISIQLVNQTSRPIEQIFIFPRGETKRGTSWTSLSPGAATTVKLKEGNFELVAVSAKRRIDAKFSERPEATTQLELREDLASTPRKLIFHDDGQTPMGVDQPGTLGVAFMISAPEQQKTDEPTTEPAPASP